MYTHNVYAYVYCFVLYIALCVTSPLGTLRALRATPEVLEVTSRN